ncbi:MAG: hotdog domain-containing protein [Burkholderiaceae bacterium]
MTTPRSPSPAPAPPLKPPADYELMLRVAPRPADVNGNGDIFGGWVMSQVDIAGGLAAARRARGRVVTVAVNAFLFKEPVSVGDAVSFYTKVMATGRTSITVHVEVFATRKPSNPVTVKVTEATLTYVAIESSGVKREVPPEPPPSA